jgi:hypothetical protein
MNKPVAVAPIPKTSFVAVDTLRDFLDSAAPGATIVYATGNLAADCEHDRALRGLRELAWRGRCFLTQRRVGKSFEYRATKASDRARNLRPSKYYYTGILADADAA